MKFKRGSKVEVLRTTKEQTNSWFPGRITYACGDEYIVKYEWLLNLEGGEVVEKVNREHIRPQPPVTKEEEKWMAGDITEVFDIHCWKVGKVVKPLKSNRFVIRLFGSIQLKEFHQLNLRVRQAWQNPNWVLIGKVISGDSLGLGGGHPLLGNKEECVSRKKEGEQFKTSDYMRMLKRDHSCNLDDEVMEIGSRKRKMTTKAEGCDGLPTRTRSFSKQLDGISFAEANVGKSYAFGYSENRVLMEKRSPHLVEPFSMPTQITEYSNGCSVASCSGNGLLDYRNQTSQKSFKGIFDSSCDDAESLCPVSLNEFLPSEDTLDANVRELELQAYRRTLQALYASGPLSWEQESLLTNLRLSLHISNEEHLLLLRRLLSAEDY